MDYFTVYKITNLTNSKYYIGKHICRSKCRHRKEYFDGVCCAYMGSGGSSKGGGFKAAKEKYGLENFKKEILFVFETEAEMNEKEAELVTEELIASGSVYNLCPGGQGGWGYINTLPRTEAQREAASKTALKHRGINGRDKIQWLLNNDLEWKEKDIKIENHLCLLARSIQKKASERWERKSLFSNLATKTLSSAQCG